MRLTDRKCAVLMALIIFVFAACGRQSGSNARLLGTWRYETSDVYTFQKITLTLRGDGTYTKRLEARVGGANAGGTHSGSWTANGMTVNLSGDGHFPAFSHDLSDFQKIN